MRKVIPVAVTGQPNCGKSTMFNAITGGTARVGNYPGITVERLEGHFLTKGYDIRLIDLPGTYSLTSYSMEEVVARNVICDERPDAVICMLDATALERSLYLVVQLMELGVPVVVGLNMMDEVRRKKIRIDSKKLSKLLQVPIVECTARLGIGKKELIQSVVEVVEKTKGKCAPLPISYGHDLDPVLDEMEEKIKSAGFLTDKYTPRWLAVKYLEDDENVIEKGRQAGPLGVELEAMVEKTEKRFSDTLDTYPEAIIADYRYGFINSILKQGVISREDDLRFDFSDKIDRFLTQKLLGPLIMVGLLWMMFYITFTFGTYPQGWVEDIFGFMGDLGDRFIPEGLVQSLVVSGIIDGVGAVVSFAPLILIMFAMLVFLEDLGYMARVAYMLDRLLRVFGLHGASVMPFIMSGGIPGGCAVPGVMCARTLRSPRERLATILTAPFMVCGAKTTAYLMLIAAFFPKSPTMAMFMIVLAGWLFALVVSRILRWTIIKGPATPFVMELPPYRLPTLHGVAIHTWDRVWQYLKKAGTVILAISVLMWVLMTFPRLPDEKADKFARQRVAAKQQVAEKNLSNEEGDNLVQKMFAQIDGREGEEGLKHSLAGRISASLEPAAKLAGFPWQTTIAMLGAFAAKEVFVSTMSTAYSMGDVDPEGATSLSEQLREDPGYTGPAVYSIILFLLLYTPCMVTVVAIAKESNWKWAAFSSIGALVFAYIVSVAVFQIGTALSV